MKVHSKKNLDNQASAIFDALDAGYKPCEVIYILSELARLQALAMLQSERGID